jgi:tetratricopeptide (TPR) repeat protein
MRLLVISVLLAFCGIAAASTGDCVDPDAIKAFETGRTLIQFGFVRTGVKKIEQAVSIHPDFPEAYEVLEKAYEQLGRYDDAAATAEYLIRLDPRLTHPKHAYAWEIKRYRSLAIAPEEALAALARCQRYARKANVDTERAITACEEAVRFDSTLVDAREILIGIYIHIDDEEATKRQIEALIPLHVPIASFLIHQLDHMKPEWLTEEYGDELQKLFAAHATPRKEPEILEFTGQEVDQILGAYSEEIAALKSLLDDVPEIFPADCEGRVSDQITGQLREKMLLQGIGSLDAERANCFGDRPRMYHIFDELLTRGPASKIGTDLNVSRPEYEDWRVGLIQILEDREYCKPVCNALLEFRIDTEIRGSSYQFVARMKLVDEIAEIGQCNGLHDEESSTWDW